MEIGITKSKMIKEKIVTNRLNNYSEYIVPLEESLIDKGIEIELLPSITAIIIPIRYNIIKKQI